MVSDLLRTLIVATIASSTAMLMALSLRKPMRLRFSAHAAYALWALVPLSALVALLPAPVASMSMQIVPAVVTAFTVATPASALPMANPFDPLPWLVAMWLLGAGIVCLLFIRQQRRFVRGLGRLSATGDETLRAQTTAGCPALLGAWRPRVVLPADFEQRYSTTERELILAHERTHRARGDAQINALAAALRCVFWFNPLIHFAASRFRFDQELACDAVVISRFPEARRSYADAMLKTQLADFGLPVGCHWQSSHPLKERIAMLKQPLPGRARAALGAAVAAVLIVCGTYAAWAAQPPAQITIARADSAQTASIARGGAAYRKLKRIAYPADALAAKVEGVVYVKAHVAADGSVTSASADRIDPPSATALSAAGVDGVKSWTFEAATKDGKAVASDEIVPIVFSVTPGSKHPILDATLEPIVVGPPQESKAVASSSDVAPSEDVSYRRMYSPKYPEAAIAAHQSGKLVLRVLVSATGDAKSVTVESAKPSEAEDIFGATAIDAIKHWKFNAGTRNGKPYEGYVLVPIDFSLTNDEG